MLAVAFLRGWGSAGGDGSYSVMLGLGNPCFELLKHGPGSGLEKSVLGVLKELLGLELSLPAWSLCSEGSNAGSCVQALGRLK